LCICCLKLERWGQAVENCSKVLEIDKENVKALFRKGTANAKLKNFEQALKDLNAATKLSPNDAAIKKELRLVNVQIKRQNEKEKKMYTKMFG